MNYIIVLRSYAALDHISPYINLLLKKNNVAIKIFITNLNIKLIESKIIRHLRKNSNVEVINIQNYFKKIDKFKMYIFQIFYFNSDFLILNKMINKLQYIYEKNFIFKIKIYDYILILLKDFLKKNKYNYFVTDHDSNKELLNILFFLKEKKVKTIALPHHVFFAKNKLRHELFVNKNDFDHDNYIRYKSFDVCYLSNNIQKKSINIQDKNILEKFKIIKSLRYSKLWINTLLKEIYVNEILNINNNKINLLVLLPKPFNNLSYKELVKAINILNDSNEFNILLKLPIKSYSNIKEKFNKGSFYNCKFTSEYHSSFLISKCDILVFLDTDVFLDAIIQDKMVFSLNYLNFNKYYYEDFEIIHKIDSRDDVFQIKDKYKKYNVNKSEKEKILEFFTSSNKSFDLELVNEK